MTDDRSHHNAPKDTIIGQRLKRDGRPVATPAETLKGMMRTVRTQAKRPDRADAGSNDDINLEDLPVFQAAVDACEEALHEAARRLHDEGHSWTSIGRALGVSRQAALKRFGPTSSQP